MKIFVTFISEKDACTNISFFKFLATIYNRRNF